MAARPSGCPGPCQYQCPAGKSNFPVPVPPPTSSSGNAGGSLSRSTGRRAQTAVSSVTRHVVRLQGGPAGPTASMSNNARTPSNSETELDSGFKPELKLECPRPCDYPARATRTDDQAEARALPTAATGSDAAVLDAGVTARSRPTGNFSLNRLITRHHCSQAATSPAWSESASLQARNPSHLQCTSESSQWQLKNRDPLAPLRPGPRPQAATVTGIRRLPGRRTPPRTLSSSLTRMILHILLGILLTMAQRHGALGALPAPQTSALVDVYNALSGPGWSSSTNWLTGDPCTAGSVWAGVTCSSGGSGGPATGSPGTNVLELVLPAGNLAGTLPGTLSSLSMLS